MSNSHELFERAQAVIPGGVNSPVRAFGGVGGVPVFFEHAEGAYLCDADARRYIDYVGSWGPFILGHGHPRVTEALRKQLERATSFGAPSRLEVELAELLVGLIPSLEMVRLVSSGTEATMSAIRVARGYTGREKFIKFEGCYHGHGDAFLIKAGSGMLTHGAPSSPGVTKGAAADTLVATYNDLESVRTLFASNADEIAAVIVEPVAGNMGVVQGDLAFLSGLRALCDSNGALLIFDEVMSGFRVALGGAIEVTGVQPDMVTYGKIIGGGLPVGAYGGRKEIMEVVSPLGRVYQAGTLSGNPLAVAAGLATLHTLVDTNPYPALDAAGAQLARGFSDAAAAAGVPLTVNRVGSMLTPFFTSVAVTDYPSAATSDTAAFAAFFHAMLDSGVYLPPSQFEALFISTMHFDAEIARTIDAAGRAFARIAEQERTM